MDSTTLNLLTPDGVLTVLIVPELSTDHYAELHKLVCEIEAADELRAVVRTACERWDRSVHFG